MSEDKYISLVTVEYLINNGIACQEFNVLILPIPGVDVKEMAKLRAVQEFKRQHPGCAVRRIRVNYCVPEYLAPDLSLIISNK